jgi:hypothetical protein
MKHQFFKIPLLILLLLFAQNWVKAQKACTWVGPTTGTQNFNTLSNWEYDDNGTKKAPTAISNGFTFTLSNSSFIIQLSANTTIWGLTINRGQLDFNGKTLSTNRLALLNAATVDTSKAGSKIIYTGSFSQTRIEGFLNFNLTNFFYPEGATKPNTFQIHNSKVTLTQSTTINHLWFIASNNLKGYIDLNGHSLTVNKFDVGFNGGTDNMGYIIPNINSDLILKNLTASNSNLRFADSSNNVITSGIQLKSIQKTGTGNFTVSVIGDIQIAEKIS